MERLPQQQQEPNPRSLILDCKMMESLGLLRMPLELLVTVHLHPRLLAMSSRSPSLPSNPGRFQSARVLIVLLLLTAYQADLCEHFAQTQDPVTWEEIPVITDLWLRIQCCSGPDHGESAGSLQE